MKRLASPRISFFRLPAALICLAAVFGLTSSAPAQTVESQLTAGTVQVGQPVELRITTKGKSQGQLLDEVEVEGLQVAGKQDQFQMQMSMPSFGMEVATVQTRILVPTRTGEFTIPSLRVKLDGKIYKTAESVLRVTPATGGRIPVLPAIPVPQPGTTAHPSQRSPPNHQSPPHPDPTLPREPISVRW
ncbi:MAG: BatD family protein [Terrimicrobiaceae bacterium]